MALLLGLVLGHILGDFVFQPGRLVVAKRQHQRAVILHAGIVTACTAAVLAADLRDAWPAVLLAGVAHFGVEQLSIRARRVEIPGLAVFLVDQGLHGVAIVLISAVATATVTTPIIGLWSVSLTTLATACGLCAVAFGGSVLVLEVQRSLSWTEGGPSPILGLDLRRLYGFAERAGALLAALLLPVPALGALVFVPRIGAAITSSPRRRREELTASVTGFVLCALTWMIITLLGADG